jgi:hypothetical protein
VSDPTLPFAAGVHLPWSGVPPGVRRWAEALGGGPPEQVVDLAGGFSPGAACRLVFPRGREIFVKAVGAELNPDSPSMHRREAVIAAALPDSPYWPRLISTYDDEDWVGLAFVAIDGGHPRHPWDSGELVSVLGSLERMHEALTPSPVDAVASSAEYRLSTFGGWRALASAPTVPTNLDPWSIRHLDQLAELEDGWPAACEGTTLIHGDLRSDNMLLLDGGVVFVDWPHASVGCAALELVAWAPTVELEGGPEPEALLARYAPSHQFDADVVTVLVAAVAGFLTERSFRPDPPGLPTLRAFQAAQGDVARSWLRQRTGW